MTTHAPTIEKDDPELREAEANARASGESANEWQAESRRRIQIAEDCEAEIATVEATRNPLLSKAFSGDAQAEALLAQLDPHMASLRQRARDARDAAALLKPKVDELALEAQRTARRVAELRHLREVEQLDLEAAAVLKAIPAFWLVITAYAQAAARADQSHRRVYGEPLPRFRDGSPAFHAACVLSIEARKFFGDDARALDIARPGMNCTL